MMDMRIDLRIRRELSRAIGLHYEVLSYQKGQMKGHSALLV